MFFFYFFFNDTTTSEIYTLSLHDALPISSRRRSTSGCPIATTSRPGSSPTRSPPTPPISPRGTRARRPGTMRSEEHTSELQSRLHLVCRLLLEKKKKKKKKHKTQITKTHD